MILTIPYSHYYRVGGPPNTYRLYVEIHSPIEATLGVPTTYLANRRILNLLGFLFGSL